MSGNREQLISNVSEYLDQKEAMLDTYIDSGSDHDLFIASYIHGHFSVIAANLMHAVHAPQNQSASLQQWKMQAQLMLTDSVNDAIANNELAENDAVQVTNMTDMLFLDDA